jgi:hypothetical protein
MENENNSQAPEDVAQPTELDMLKARATMMGVEFSNNIGVDKLRERIKAKMDGLPPAEDDEVLAPVAPAVPEINALTGLVADADPDAGMTTRQILMRDQLKLIRCRVSNLDPKKKELQGEVFTVANEYIGTQRKFIPFGEVTDDGFHIPQCILTVMQERKFQNIRTFRDRKTGHIRIEQNEVREFSIEILDPLTEVELRQLATAQQAAGVN